LRGHRLHHGHEARRPPRAPESDWRVGSEGLPGGVGEGARGPRRTRGGGGLPADGTGGALGAGFPPRSDVIRGATLLPHRTGPLLRRSSFPARFVPARSHHLARQAVAEASSTRTPSAGKLTVTACPGCGGTAVGLLNVSSDTTFSPNRTRI